MPFEGFSLMCCTLLRIIFRVYRRSCLCSALDCQIYRFWEPERPLPSWSSLLSFPEEEDEGNEAGFWSCSWLTFGPELWPRAVFTVLCFEVAGLFYVCVCFDLCSWKIYCRPNVFFTHKFSPTTVSKWGILKGSRASLLGEDTHDCPLI